MRVLKNKILFLVCGFAMLLAMIALFMPETNVLISVVMPVYNTEKYLEQNIQSVLSQTYKNFEFIIVDDGSTDNSPKIIQKYAEMDNRIKVFTLPQNSGAAVARNEALKHISGEYTLFIDSDDWLKRTALKKSCNYAVKHKLDIVMFLPIEFNEASQKFLEGYPIDVKRAFAYNELDKKKLKVFSYKNFPEHFFDFSRHYLWNKLIKTSLIKENNLYFDNVPHHNDSFFVIMAMLYAKRIGYIKDRLYFYRVNRPGAITINGGDTDARSVWLTLKKIKHELLVSGLYPELKFSFSSLVKGWMDFVTKAAETEPDQYIYYEKLQKLIE